MKQACSLESMVDAVLSEMKRRGNAKNTIERHERAYSQFYEYALTQGENSYSKVLARSFLEEKEKLSAYRGPRFMEQYMTAPIHRLHRPPAMTTATLGLRTCPLDATSCARWKTRAMCGIRRKRPSM